MRMTLDETEFEATPEDWELIEELECDGFVVKLDATEYVTAGIDELEILRPDTDFTTISLEIITKSLRFACLSFEASTVCFRCLCSFAAELNKKKENQNQKPKPRGASATSRAMARGWKAERRLSAGELRQKLPLMIAEENPPVKPIRKRKVKTETSERKYFTEQDRLLAQQWVLFAKAKSPWIHFNENEFAHAIAKIRASTNLNHDGVRAVFEFIKDDSFWCDVAISPVGLLKKASKSEVRKIDTILRRMKARETKNNQVLKAQEKMIYEPVADEWNPFYELT
jgi:hypothetical protein